MAVAPHCTLTAPQSPAAHYQTLHPNFLCVFCPSTSHRVPDLPIELLEKVAQWSQTPMKDPDELRRMALVSKAWAAAARKVLWRQSIKFETAGAIKRCRDAVDNAKELATYIRKVDLSSFDDCWEQKNVSEYFRRATGLLRQTSKLTHLYLLHLGLGSSQREKFYAALGSLDLSVAKFDATSWSHRSHAQLSDAEQDIRLFTQTLCGWRNLQKLHLYGYSHHPKLLDPVHLPAHIYPSYSLKSLNVSSSELSGATLIWLLGQPNPSRLSTLTLTNVTGLRPEDYDHLFSLCASTLQKLNLSIDQDEFDPLVPSASRCLPPKTFERLTLLEQFEFTTDMDIKQAILPSLTKLPALRDLTLNAASLSALRAMDFVASCSPTLATLSLNIWGEDLSWTCLSRYQIAKICRILDINLTIEGQTIDACFDAWFGWGPESTDLSAYWAILEGRAFVPSFSAVFESDEDRSEDGWVSSESDFDS